jgi:hypothetical protein
MAANVAEVADLARLVVKERSRSVSQSSGRVNWPVTGQWLAGAAGSSDEAGVVGLGLLAMHGSCG